MRLRAARQVARALHLNSKEAGGHAQPLAEQLGGLRGGLGQHPLLAHLGDRIVAAQRREVIRLWWRRRGSLGGSAGWVGWRHAWPGVPRPQPSEEPLMALGLTRSLLPFLASKSRFDDKIRLGVNE